MRSNSLFQVRSPKYRARNFPNVTWLPTDCSSSVLPTGCPETGLTTWGLNDAQYGFGLPAPGSGALIASPAEVTTRTSSPATGTLSPGFTTVCFTLLYSSG